MKSKNAKLKSAPIESQWSFVEIDDGGAKKKGTNAKVKGGGINTLGQSVQPFEQKTGKPIKGKAALVTS